MGFFNETGGLFSDISCTMSNTSNCSICKAYLSNKCQHPKLDGYVGTNDILLILPEPNSTEDTLGRCGVGAEYRWLKQQFFDVGLDFDACSKINLIGCYNADRNAIEYCHRRLKSFVDKVKPRLILSFGDKNVWSMVHTEWTDSIGSIDKWRGFTIPSRYWGAWVCNVMSLEDICTSDNFPFNEGLSNATDLGSKYQAVCNEPYYKTHELFVKRDIRRAYIKSREEFPVDLYKREYTKQLTAEESISYMKEAYHFLSDNSDEFVTVDLETTGIAPYNKGHSIRTMGVCYKDHEAVAFPVTEINTKAIKKFMTSSNIRYVNANIQFEKKWFKAIFGIDTHWCHDIIVYQHMIDQRESGITSLKFQSYVHLGVPLYNESVHRFLVSPKGSSYDVNGSAILPEGYTKTPHDLNDIYNAPLDDLCYYNCLDVLFTRHLAKMQFKHYKESNVKNKHLAYEILMEGANTFATIEYNGFPIDRDYLEKQIEACTNKVTELEEKLWNSDIGRKWKEVYADKASLESNPQIIDILVNKCGLWANGVSRKKKPRADKGFVERIKHPWVTDFLTFKKYNKILYTYLLNIKKNTDENGYLHCDYALNRASSMRSSASNPSFQNLPSRDSEMLQIVKGCIKAPDDFVFSELDQSNLEVRSSCILHKDRNLINYIKTGGDFHSDTGKDAFIMSNDEWSDFKKWSEEKGNKQYKKARHIAKNSCVFPFFYNSVASNIGAAVWDTISYTGIEVSDSLKMRDYLIDKLGMQERYKKDSADPSFKRDYGFTDVDEYYTYYYTKHMEYVEDQFWNVRFKDYSEWKKQNYNNYLRDGYLDSPIGIRYELIMRRTQSSNLVNQGMAFLMGMLYPLICLEKFIKENNLEDKIRMTGQIHDSSINILHKDIINIFGKNMQYFMRENLYKKFPFINVPLESELEVSPVGGRWSEKEVYEIA